ncbi:MAG TPA: PQQ-dependent sugar dehydrogenase [Vicinamibacteria bacterium]|nr:PQQ-dependent sugar dehydrogenase [Vicinamibacteria bacterium]
MREANALGVRVVLLAVAVSACGGGDSPSPGSPTATPPGSTCSAGTPVSGTPGLTTTLVGSGLSSPVDLQAPPGDRERVFVLEQAGRVRIFKKGNLLSAPFLDIASRVGSGGERGLLGLAFHPRYAENGRFFVNYTDRSGDTHIAEFRAPAPAGDVADAASEKLVLFADQPYSNHNGGGLAFGNDGMLYVGLGDGGSGGDPQGNGQSLGSHLGKMLRLDVDGGSPYRVPADNPFVNTSGARPEIWSYGLRNPWRFAFDRITGDLLIADVGQNAMEEIDLGVASRKGGENYGWSVMEGSRCYQPGSGCATVGLTLPVAEYSHGEGCSITGGVVYRGCRLPGYHGSYFYSDYCTPFVRSFRVESGRAVDLRDWTATLGRGLSRPSSFGVDGDGEIYIVDHDGEIYKVVPAS